MISKKTTIISILTFFLSLALITAGPFVVKYFLDKNIRATKIENLKFYKLHFSDTLIVEFDLKNCSKMDFKTCLVETKVVKKSNSKLKSLLYRLKPILLKPIIYNEQLEKNSSTSKRVVFDNFRYRGNFNVLVTANCY
jgi:hypothetical protein